MKVSIKAMRVNRGLTIGDASEKIGVIRQTLSNWEKGVTSPTATQLNKLTKVYECELDDIILPEKST